LSFDSKKLVVAHTGQRCALCGKMFERYAVPHKGELVCIECAMERLNLSIFGLEVEGGP
jgi:formylmethanofuran dehydrogenase subunit E